MSDHMDWESLQRMQEEVLQLAADAGEPVDQDDAQWNEPELVEYDRYIEALKVVLGTREGLIVLRHWLDSMAPPGRIYVNNSLVSKNAVLQDVVNERMEEIAVAGFKFYQKISHEGFRLNAYRHKLRKLLKK